MLNDEQWTGQMHATLFLARIRSNKSKAFLFNVIIMNCCVCGAIQSSSHVSGRTKRHFVKLTVSIYIYVWGHLLFCCSNSQVRSCLCLDKQQQMLNAHIHIRPHTKTTGTDADAIFFPWSRVVNTFVKKAAALMPEQEASMAYGKTVVHGLGVAEVIQSTRPRMMSVSKILH